MADHPERVAYFRMVDSQFYLMRMGRFNMHSEEGINIIVRWLTILILILYDNSLR